MRSAPARKPATVRKGAAAALAENIQRVLPDAVTPPQEVLAAYWRRVAKDALPYLGGRPLTLVRHVNGVTFFHEGPLPPVPPAVHQLRMRKSSGERGTRLWIDSIEGLLGLVEMGVIELHPWGATVDNIERPDTLVFDLDPGEGVEWPFVTETAIRLREVLSGEGLEPWPKVTGGKGLHVMAAVDREMDWPGAKAFTRRVAEQIAEAAPDRYTTSAALAKRPGRLSSITCGTAEARPQSERTRPELGRLPDRSAGHMVRGREGHRAGRVHAGSASATPSRADQLSWQEAQLRCDDAVIQLRLNRRCHYPE